MIGDSDIQDVKFWAASHGCTVSYVLMGSQIGSKAITMHAYFLQNSLTNAA